MAYSTFIFKLININVCSCVHHFLGFRFLVKLVVMGIDSGGD